jgi:hypothetical protein
MYDSPRGAAAGKVRLDRLSQRGAVDVVDAATVTWVKGAHRPRIGRPRLASVVTTGRTSPLETLLRRLFSPDRPTGEGWAPSLLAFRGAGLTEDFLRSLRGACVPDRSALVVLSRGAALEDVQVVVERGRARGDVSVIHLRLTADGLAVLEALAATETAAEPPQDPGNG